MVEGYRVTYTVSDDVLVVVVALGYRKDLYQYLIEQRLSARTATGLPACGHQRGVRCETRNVRGAGALSSDMDDISAAVGRGTDISCDHSVGNADRSSPSRQRQRIHVPRPIGRGCLPSTPEPCVAKQLRTWLIILMDGAQNLLMGSLPGLAHQEVQQDLSNSRATLIGVDQHDLQVARSAAPLRTLQVRLDALRPVTRFI